MSHTTLQRHQILFATAFALASLAAVASQPARASQASEEKMGASAVAEINKSAKFVTDPAVIARVEGVEAKIAVIADTDQVNAGFGNDTVYNFKYKVHVIDEKDVNAFSLPGGNVYIYKGLLDLLVSDDELAGVLSHETAHAAHHHVVYLEREAGKMSTQMMIGVLVALLAKVPPAEIGDLAATGEYLDEAILNNHFSEAAEEDADHTGMIYMTKAGYNPVGMLTMLQRLEDVEKRSPEIDLGFLQDHPLTPQRIASAKQELTGLGYSFDQRTIWMVSESMHARVVNADGTTKPAIKVMFGSRVIALMAPENRQGASDAAGILNSMLINPELYQIHVTGSSVTSGNRTLFTFNDADAAVQPVSTTPAELAQNAADAIRLALWNVSVRGIEAN